MKILNVGSLNLDYVYAVEHFVRPGETISSLGMEVFCGGKGLNQSIALARAGGEVYHAGCIGADGTMLKQRLEDNGIHTDYLQVVNGASGHAIIQVDASGQNCILLYGGANQQVSCEQIDAAIALFSEGDILLLQNEINNLPYIMEAAHRKGMQIALNPSPINAQILQLPLHLVTYFLLNEIEGTELSGETESSAIASALLAKYPQSKIVLTLGKRGVVYYDGVNTYTHGIYKVNVVDTTAAGDTFTGYFLASLTMGLDVPTALERASVASSLAVSRAGASDSIPMLDEVIHHTLQKM